MPGSRRISRPDLSVLIVDDDRTSLMITQTVLEREGYRVAIRDSAIGTSAVILRERPDVVLLDIEMPGLNGDRLLELLRGSRMGQDTVFILHSGARSADLDVLVARTGAKGGIVKTGDQAKFVKEFERIVSSALRAS